MKRIILVLSIAFLGLQVYGQSKDKTIITIDNKAIPLEDFIYVYEKNNSKQTNLYTQESLREHLNLFINYRLKVTEAENRKLDTSKAFITELEGYRKQLAKPYMSDDSFLDKMVEEAYQRLNQDVNTSHILIKVDENASPEDTLIAYNKAIDIRKLALKGEDFGQLAIKYSEDPSSKDPAYEKGYKGFLGYNLAFAFVYPYETAAYRTEVGQVSMPTRSKFGYHIIKVNEKRKNTGEVKVAHIMIDAREGIDAEDSIAKYTLANDVYKELQKGADWNATCLQYSSDQKSAPSGGELMPFQLDGTLRVPSFEKAAFALKNIGDFSTPVKTPYGWHIIKLVEKIPVKPFDSLKEELTKKVKGSDRFSLNQVALMKKLKEENKFKESKKIASTLSVLADSSLITGNWAAPANFKGKKTIFSLNKNKFTYANFFTYLEKNQKNVKAGLSPKAIIAKVYDQYVDKTVYDYAEAQISLKHSDYRLLLKEFRDGIMFFELMQKEVWDKASADTAGLKAHYEANKQNYIKPLEQNVTIYKAKNAQDLAALIKAVEAGKTEAEVKAQFNKESSLVVTSETKTFESGKNEWVDQIRDGAKSLKIQDGTNFAYIKVNETIPEGIKPYLKCRGLVISEYQAVVEKQWVASLKKKYNVVINEDVLKSLAK